VTFSATVIGTPGSGTPTGSVQFSEGGTTLGTVALVSGAASLSISDLPTGSDVITAVYSGDANFSPSTGSIAQTVKQAQTATTLGSTLNPSTYYQPVTFTANVAPTTGSGMATGTVTFLNGTQTFGSATLSNGSASFSIFYLPAGTDSITAAYNGDANCLKSTSTALSQVVNQATTGTTLQSSQNPSLVNTAVTFTATVTPQYGGSATGTVTFYENGTAIGAPVTVSAGQASITATFTSAGMFSIAATYSGDTNFMGSTGSLSQQVNASLVTTTTLTTSRTPSLVGQTVTFTAQIHPSSGSIPNGEMVTFLDGGTAIGTGTTSGNLAIFSTAALAAGTHSITASYPGDVTYQGSVSNTVDQVVQKYQTRTALASSANPSTYGQSVTLTATVTTGGPPPTGTVTFKNGNAGIGIGTVSGGAATLTTSRLSAGTNSLTAVYGGSAASAPSISAPVSQVVKPANTTITLTSSKNPSNSGQSVTFTAMVTSAYATPTGTVTFTMGSTTLGTATLAAGKARFTTSTLPVGSDTITASYNATTNFVGSSASLTQTVN